MMAEETKDRFKSSITMVFPGILAGVLIATIFGVTSIADGYGDVRLSVSYLMVFIPAFMMLSFILSLYGKWRKIPPTAFNNISLLCLTLVSFFILFTLGYTLGSLFERYTPHQDHKLFRILNLGFSSLLSLLLFLWLSGLQRKAHKYSIIALAIFSLAFWQLTSFKGELSFKKEENVNNAGPNVLLLTVESLNYGYLGCNGNKEIKTPSLDAFAKEGIVFDNYFVQAPYTTASLPTLLTGCYPFNHRAIKFGEKPLAKYRPFFEELAPAGYRVEIDAALFSQQFPGSSQYNNHNFFNKDVSLYKNIMRNLPAVQDVTNLLLGKYMPALFDRYCFGRTTSMHQTTALLRRIRLNRDKKWFFWTHFSENCHFPYRAPPSFVKMYSDNKSVRKSFDQEYMEYLNSNPEKITDEVKQELKVLYSAEVSCIDRQIGMILNSLKKLNLLEKTVILITSDHGELLGEYNYIGHGKYIKDPLIHAPLIIHIPGYYERGKRITQFVEEVGIAPTILDMCSIKRTERIQPFDGRSFLSLIYSNEWYKNFIYSSVVRWDGETFRCAYRTKEYKLIWDSTKNGFELYDLMNDPGERENVIQRNPAVANELEQQLFAFVKKRSQTGDGLASLRPDTVMRVDEDMRETLRALGYIK